MIDPLNEYIDPELLVRFLSGDANDKEQDKVKQWIDSNDRNKEYFQHVVKLWESSKGAKDFKSINIKEDWEAVRSRLISEDKLEKGPQILRRERIKYLFLKVAAVVVILLSALFYWPYLTKYLNTTSTIIAKDNQPQITLPDGSKVHLNKNAKISFPKSFNGGKREVELVGEAFFEVIKNENQPFFINSGKTITEVVGTTFNVNSNDFGHTTVTVLTGKVLLYEAINRAEKIGISIGEQGQFIKGEGLMKYVNNDVNFLSWKTGELIFRNTEIEQVIKDLNRHYNQNIELDASWDQDYTLTATFKQSELKDILAEMQLALPIQIKRKHNGITISAEI